MKLGAKRVGWLTALGLVVALGGALGCGGGGGDSAAVPAHTPAPQPTSAPAQAGSFSAGGGGGGGGFGGGGGGGFVSGGGGGRGTGGVGGRGGGVQLSGLAAMLHRREMARQARIERAHRPPGPSRLTGLTPDEQRHADVVTAARAATPEYEVDDDSCERSWAQHVAFEEALHEQRHDGLMPSAAELAEHRRAFLVSCRAEPEETQQCVDADYARAHTTECQERTLRTRTDAQTKTRRMRTTAHQASDTPTGGSVAHPDAPSP